MTPKKETIALYNFDGWKKWFALWRFWAAPYSYVEKLVPTSGTIVELGCGEGLFSNFIALSSKKRKVIGVELDSERLSIAQKNLPNTKFIRGNALTVKLPKADCIVMFHLLHHLKGHSSQDKLIERAIKFLNVKGKLIIVEIDADNSPKYYLTWFWDHFMVPWFFEKRLYQSEIYFRNVKAWTRLFKDNNLKFNVKKYDLGMPFSHIIYVCSNKK